MSEGKTTIVTALYDIGRGSMKDECNNYRPFNQYLEWFQYLLSLNCPMVIYCDEDTKKWIQEDKDTSLLHGGRRRVYSTTHKIMPYTDLPLFKKYGNKVEEIVSRPSESRRLEIIHPSYCLLVLSKFDMLKETAESNPYHSDYFIWVDAGYFRAPPSFITSKPWPDPYKMRHLEDGKYLMQLVRTPSTITNPKTYLSEFSNDILACIHGGNRDAVLFMHREVDKWVKRMVTEYDLINNEQQVMSLILSEGGRFLLYPYSGDGRRMIEELAYDTKISIGYPHCSSFITIGVCTKEVKEWEMDVWKRTAHYYGYNTVIVGRDKAWSGWKGRTQTYIDECKKREETHVILSDVTDVVFTEPAWKAWELLKTLKRPIIGGEAIVAYNGNRDLHTVETYFMRVGKSRFAYPNGGLLGGQRQQVISILEANKNAPDDQAGYMELMMDRKIEMGIDYETLLFGNIPNYHDKAIIEKDFWIQPRKGKFLNPLSGHSPCLVHFPGRNFTIRNMMCDLGEGTDQALVGWNFLIVSLILAVLLALVAYLVLD